MERTLLHIGGNRLQSRSIRWARDAGLEVAVTDADTDAPGRPLAHRFEPIPAGDVDRLVAFARELDASGALVGAYTSDRAGIEAVAAVGHATGTPANSIEAVRNAIDREGALGRLSRAGLPVANAGDERHDQIEYDVDAVLRDGAFVEGGILQRVRTIDGVAELGLMEPTLRTDERRSIYALVENAARELDLTTGPIGAHLIVRSDGSWEPCGPRMCEILPCFREEITNTIVAPLAVGKSPAQAWFASLCETGGPFDSMPTRSARGEEPTSAGWIAIRADEPGVLEGIEGLDRARAMRGIEGLCILAKKGDELPDPRDERSLVGYLCASAWSIEEVESRLREARDRLHVKVGLRDVA